MLFDAIMSNFKSCTTLFKFFFQLSLLGLLSCKNEEVNKRFELMESKLTGVDFANILVGDEQLNIIEYLYFYNGGGVGLGDINNDGLVDIYFTSNQGENKLYLNKGNWKFEDITQKAGVDGQGGWSTGVTMADVNGDGLLDIYVCQVADYKGLKGSNKLYINQGDLTFKEEAAAYGLDFVGFSTHAAFFDYDGDGDLDLYLLNHSIKKPEVFAPAKTRDGFDEKGGDRLFQSQIAQGKKQFLDVSKEAGIYQSSLGFGLGIGISDLNGDGWPDIYVSNDFTENDYLYINQQDGTFKEVLESAISYTSRYSMGNDLADFNNDGWIDIITTDMLPSDPYIWQKSAAEDKTDVFDIKLSYGYGHQYVRNTLQMNLGNGRFSEIANFAGLAASDWSWSPLIADLDNDGLKDIHISNGIVKRPNDLDYVAYMAENTRPATEELIRLLPAVKIPNRSFRNINGMRFESVESQWGLDHSSYSNGSALADLDNDGDLDLVINNTDQVAFIYQNHTNKEEKSFFRIALKQNGINPYAIGARVEIYSQLGMQVQENYPSRGFQSSTHAPLHFGLDTLSVIDSILVSWPFSDEKEVYETKEINQLLVLERGKGRISIPPAKKLKEIISISDMVLPYSHEENLAFKEYNQQFLIPKMYSTQGPAIAVGDVNGDGREDIFLGGAKGQAGVILLQNEKGQFEARPQADFERMRIAEDIDALFFDADGDGDLDLYVISGGNEFTETQIMSMDRLYKNDGKGNFSFDMNALPPVSSNGAQVKLIDLDEDGNQEIVVISNAVTGQFGVFPKHYVLKNNGKGQFSDASHLFPFLKSSEAYWNTIEIADINQDGKQDVVLAGDWNSVQIWINKGKGQFEQLIDPEIEKRKGWWTSVLIQDVNKDGLPDILLGNAGLNLKVKASEQQPINLYALDFDGNGQMDPILFHYLDGKQIPFSSRDDLIKQVPLFKKRHTSYEAYASLKSPQDLLTKEELEKAKVFEANELASGVFIQTLDGKFRFQALPDQAQLSPIMAWESFNANGKDFNLGAGNFYGYRTDIGRADAWPFSLLKWEGDAFKLETNTLNHADTWGEFRKLKTITISDEMYLLAVRNNDTIVILKIHGYEED